MLRQLSDCRGPGIVGGILTRAAPALLLQLALVAAAQPRPREGPARTDQGGKDAESEFHGATLVTVVDGSRCPRRKSDRRPRRQSYGVATLRDLDEIALSLPQATKEVSDDGRPSYLVHGKFFCLHRSRRRDAVDPETGERLDDVLMFRVADLGVKELMLADDRGVYFTTPHFDGYSAVLLRIPDLARLDRDELEDLVVEAWLTRAQKRVAKAWLAEHGATDG